MQKIGLRWIERIGVSLRPCLRSQPRSVCPEVTLCSPPPSPPPRSPPVATPTWTRTARSGPLALAVHELRVRPLLHDGTASMTTILSHCLTRREPVRHEGGNQFKRDLKIVIEDPKVIAKSSALVAWCQQQPSATPSSGSRCRSRRSRCVCASSRSSRRRRPPSSDPTGIAAQGHEDQV